MIAKLAMDIKIEKKKCGYLIARKYKHAKFHPI